ncbi:MAG: VCBS repeat-containing protein [SAR324 cluster bacterium]|nr:VCBS repeat-containing protein [SAR324 cluster bacterium]
MMNAFQKGIIPQYIFTVLLFLGGLIPNLLLAQPEADIIYTWNREYYGLIDGQQHLLYTRSFANSHLTFGDIDGDDDNDLIVGKQDGQLAYFENTGTKYDPVMILRTEEYKAWFQETDDNQKTKRFPKIINVGGYASPFLYDLDEDGDLDLLVGSKDGSIFFYENKGNALLPIFELITPIYMGLRPGNNTVIRLADVNGDRVADLLVGTRDGQVLLYPNGGKIGNPFFCDPNLRFQAEQPCLMKPILIDKIRPEIHASPEFIDWDYDGDLDVVVGKSNGKLNFYLNEGTPLAPNWKLESDRFLYIDAVSDAAPVFYDWRNDGFPELFMGSSQSRVIYYENREVLSTGLKDIPDVNFSLFNWNLPPEKVLTKFCERLNVPESCFEILKKSLPIPADTPDDINSIAKAVLKTDSSFTSTALTLPKVQPAPSNTTASPTDNAPGTPPAGQINAVMPKLQVNTNTDPNAVAQDPNAANPPGPTNAETATQEPKAQLVLTRNRLWLKNRNFFNFTHLAPEDRRTILTSGDWNKDGKQDLMIGTYSGKIFAYNNNGTPQKPDWHAITVTPFQPNQREFSAPTLVDIDGDGDLDLIVGNRTGRLELIKNKGNAQKPDWSIEDLYFANVDVGSYSVPVFKDLDQDGDQDLFVGNGKGRIAFYQNMGTARKPHFVLKSTRFSQIIVARNAAPAFFNWNEDPHPDLLIGGNNGQIKLVSFNPLPEYPVTQGWELKKNQWDGLETIGFSTPHLWDVNGDGKMDLFMGDEEGNTLLWLNQGFQKAEEYKPEEEIILETSNSLEAQDVNDVSTETSDATEAVVSDEPMDSAIQPETTEMAEIPVVPFDPVFKLVSKNYENLKPGNKTVPVFFDLDGDGDLDLFVGTKEGDFFHYLNEGDVTNSKWTLVTKKYLNYEGGKNPTPVFADMDMDGDQDLIVGDADGKIHYWENRGTPEYAEFVFNPAPFSGVTGGRNSRPAVLDANGDGLPDLVIGNFEGQMRLYIQEKTGNGFSFKLLTRQFMDLDVGIGATPVLADINYDQKLELVIGSDQGKLFGFQPAAGDQKNQWGWLPNDKYFKDLDLPFGSTPAFADIDGDGDMDMFIGNEKEGIYFFRNEGKP